MRTRTANAARALSVVLVALAGCSDSSKSGFSQSDLAGRWDRITFSTNDAAGWLFHAMTVDASGHATFDACANPLGACTVTADVTYAVDASGNVTASGSGSNPTLHGTMTSGKDLIFATASLTNTGTGALAGFSLQVFRKRVPGVAWSTIDVASFPFVYQALHSGANANWERGAGTTSASGAVTLIDVTTPAGHQTPPAPGFVTVQVDANGLVSLAEDPSFHGFMTADKKAIFGVLTAVAGPPAEYEIMALLGTGASFAQADLAGTWSFNALTSGLSVAGSTWVRGTLQIDAAGAVTFPSATTPGGTTTVAGFDLALASSGALSRPTLASYLGQVAFHKDFFVRTQTLNGDSMAIVAR